MGFFDSLRQASAESPGRVMMGQLESANSAMGAMSIGQRIKVLTDFCQKREDIIPRLSNMSTDGKLKTGIDLQVAGNKLLQSVPVEGYPLLLVGMWVESGYRPGASAEVVYQSLEAIAIDLGGSRLV